MKKFIYKIGLWSGLFVGFNLIIYFLFFNHSYKDYNQFSNIGNVFIMADSHGQSLKNFTEEYSIVNFSYESDSYSDIERKLNYLLKKSKINKLILSVDNHCFSQYREVINNNMKSIYFESIFSDDYVYENFKNKYIRYYFPVFNNNSPTIIKVEMFKKLKGNDNLDKNSKNWKSLSIEEKNKESIKRLSVQFESKSYSKKLVESFENIISIAKKNNIEIIGIKFPISKNYYSNLVEFDQLKMDKFLLEKKLRVLDFQKIYFDHDEYFKDADHLNDKGAILFSKILNDSIQKIAANK